MLDYQYFKDHYQLTAIDLSKQKSLDADWRAIQQIEFYGMLKTNSQPCTLLEKSKEIVLEFYKGTAKVLWIVYMVEFGKVNVKLTDTQPKKLKTTAKNKTGATLRMGLKMFDGDNLPHKLFWQQDNILKTKVRKAFNNNM